MRALTLWPEWAWAICHLGKRIENRTWPVPSWMRGEQLAIHAGGQVGGNSGSTALLSGVSGLLVMAERDGWSYSAKRFLKKTIVKRIVVDFWRGNERLVFDTDEIPRKAIVATCEILEVPLPRLSRVSNPWAVDHLEHWELCGVVVLPKAVSINGSQGLWHWHSHSNGSDA